MRLSLLLLLLCTAATLGRLPDPSFTSGVPLFAHVRWSNFSTADLAGLARFRSVTVQVEPDSPLPCEAQARDVRARLGDGGPPVLMYGNLFFAEPNCAYAAAFSQRPDLWLNGSDGVTPYLPGGRRTFDMSVPATAGWWAANVIAAAAVDGGFGDGGCGHAPSWFNASRAAAFAAGDGAAHAAATAAAAPASLYVVNCPVLPAIGDDYLPGTRAYMLESWCSDFQPRGAGVATYCRDELLEALVLGAWGNMSMQARFYLSAHNAGDPQFGLAAFLIAAWPGAYFGASADWDWAGDWQKMLAWPWANYTLGGAPAPAVMGDKQGCGWTRAYPHANVSVDLCSKHLFARIDWLQEGGGDSLAAAAPRAPPPPQPQPEERLAPPLPRRARIAEPARGEPCPSGAAQVAAPWARDGRACLSV